MSSYSQQGWAAAHASVIGRSHVAHNIPCQDNHGWFPLTDNPAWGVAVVSDGAGSCANSHIGSHQIIQLLNEQLSQLLAQQGWAKGAVLPDADTWRVLARDVFQKTAVQLQHYASANSLEYRSLSATAIAMVFSPEALLITHIGDGRAAGQLPDGTWIPLLTPYRGAEANSTVFLTSRSWVTAADDQYIGSEVFHQPFRAFALLTDGCEMTAFSLSRRDEATGYYESLNEPFAPVLDNAATQIKTFYEQGMAEEKVNELWAKYLLAGTERLANEPDDKTLLLAVRTEVNAPEVVTFSSQVASQATEPEYISGQTAPQPYTLLQAGGKLGKFLAFKKLQPKRLKFKRRP